MSILNTYTKIFNLFSKLCLHWRKHVLYLMLQPTSFRSVLNLRSCLHSTVAPTLFMRSRFPAKVRSRALSAQKLVLVAYFPACPLDLIKYKANQLLQSFVILTVVFKFILN